MKVLVPMKRDIRLWPPVISLIKGLLRLGHHVDHFSYYCSPETLASVKDEQGLHVETVSSEPYPGQQQLPVRALATWRARRGLVRFLAGHHDCDLIWLGEWDYPGIMRMVRRAGIRCPVVYQLHELNPRRFKPCRQVDYVVVPEENRAWLTKFGAGLDRLPLVLPNCPLDHPRRVAEHVDPVLEGLCRAGKRVVLCPGGVGVGGAGIHMRCILEMIEAMASTPKSFVLAIMPTATPDATTRSKLESHAAAHGVADRMVLLENRVAPRAYEGDRQGSHRDRPVPPDDPQLRLLRSEPALRSYRVWHSGDSARWAGDLPTGRQIRGHCAVQA